MLQPGAVRRRAELAERAGDAVTIAAAFAKSAR